MSVFGNSNEPGSPISFFADSPLDIPVTGNDIVDRNEALAAVVYAGKG